MSDAKHSHQGLGLVFRKAVDLDEISGRYGPILNEIVQKLRAIGINLERCYAVKDIVLEYLNNIDLHRLNPAEPSPLPIIEIRNTGDAITVTMEGTGRKDDVQRMDGI